MPFFGEMLAGTFGFALAIIRQVLVHDRARARGDRVLDGKAVMPMIGLYAHRYGIRAALDGIPADHLMETVASASAEEEVVVSQQMLSMGVSVDASI